MNLCKDCRHARTNIFANSIDAMYWCGRTIDPVHGGSAKKCRDERASGQCGPAGIYFEQRPPAAATPPQPKRNEFWVLDAIMWLFIVGVIAAVVIIIHTVKTP